MVQNPADAVLKVRQLASELDGMKGLKQLVDGLVE